MADELIIRGLLEEAAVPELLRSVCKSKESGVLTCFLGDNRKSIYFNDGQIIFASSSDNNDRLGESLLKYGRITIRNFLDATKHVRPDIRLGTLLCENNSLTPEELVEGVRRQTRDIIMSLFHVQQGRYELVLKQIDTHEMIVLNENSDSLILEGVKSIEAWSRISKGIGSYSNALKPSEESQKILMNLGLSPEESHLVSLCNNGRFTVEEICGMSYLTNYETCRILWGLMIIGVLEAVDSPVEQLQDEAGGEPQPDLQDLVENYNDVYSYIYDFAVQKLGEEADHLAMRAMDQVQHAVPDIARGLQLDTYGRLDFDALLKNLTPIPESGRVGVMTGALEEIIYALLYEVGSSCGADEQTRLSAEIQKLRRH